MKTLKRSPISCFFFLFFLLVQFSGRTAKFFLRNVLRLVIKEACEQDVTCSLVTSKNISEKNEKMVTEFIISNKSGT